ncbi:MAG: hypothetical protein AAGA75_14225 [Cyanobacteria bacterium P01_E01_bin.6]
MTEEELKASEPKPGTGISLEMMQSLYSKLQHEFLLTGEQPITIPTAVKDWFHVASVLQVGCSIIDDGAESNANVRVAVRTFIYLVTERLKVIAPVYAEVLSLGWDSDLHMTEEEFDETVKEDAVKSALQTLSIEAIALHRASGILHKMQPDKSLDEWLAYLLHYSTEAYLKSENNYIREKTNHIYSLVERFRKDA